MFTELRTITLSVNGIASNNLINLCTNIVIFKQQLYLRLNNNYVYILDACAVLFPLIRERLIAINVLPANKGEGAHQLQESRIVHTFLSKQGSAKCKVQSSLVGCGGYKNTTSCGWSLKCRPTMITLFWVMRCVHFEAVQKIHNQLIKHRSIIFLFFFCDAWLVAHLPLVGCHRRKGFVRHVTNKTDSR